MWYNQTEVATKTELEKVKGMIDVSARLVYSVAVPDGVDAVSIPVDYDYVIITTTFYNINYSNDTTVGSCYQYNVTVNKGGTAYIPAVYAGSYNKPSHGHITAEALTREISFNTMIEYSFYTRLTIVAYKY